jgi:hypothetical protein
VGVLCPRSAKLKKGDEVRCFIPPPEPLEAVPEDIPLDIVYEDHHLIVVNKQAHLVVHPAPGNRVRGSPRCTHTLPPSSLNRLARASVTALTAADPVCSHIVAWASHHTASTPRRSPSHETVPPRSAALMRESRAILSNRSESHAEHRHFAADLSLGELPVPTLDHRRPQRRVSPDG